MNFALGGQNLIDVLLAVLPCGRQQGSSEENGPCGCPSHLWRES